MTATLRSTLAFTIAAFVLVTAVLARAEAVQKQQDKINQEQIAWTR